MHEVERGEVGAARVPDVHAFPTLLAVLDETEIIAADVVGRVGAVLAETAIAAW
ncbi:hypothetical protein P9869_24455 [Streptomyces ossamyceticus]|nr:hypothetical protein [Streptomyces ossamyceticus]